MSRIDHDELEMDEIGAQVDDLFEKISRDISEGRYSPYIAVMALLRITVVQLLGSAKPMEAFSLFVGDLDAEFDAGLKNLPPYENLKR